MRGIIYKIIDNTNEDVYYGSTIKKLEYRMSDHKLRCNYKHKCMSYTIIKNNDYNASVVEEVEFEDIKQLRQRELFYIQNNKCINKVYPTISKKEQGKKYYNNNKEKWKTEEYKLKKKQYRENNKEIISEKAKEKITCECGACFRKDHYKRHLTSKKHLKFIS